MISGNIKNINQLLPYLSANLQEALTYLATTDFTQIPNGEYEIRGREIFARVNSYLPEPKNKRRAERHEAYIDVQFIVYGREAVWYIPQKTCFQVTESMLKDNDVEFFANPKEHNCTKLEAGDFAIFFPWELHRPNCIYSQSVRAVKKVVVKVKAL